MLLVVALATGGALELLGAGAVLLSFGHAQVADRLAEREAARERPGVECHRWAARYLVGKELLWCVYFVAHGSWAALAGVGLFLSYPSWRRFWRTGRGWDRQNDPGSALCDPGGVGREPARRGILSSDGQAGGGTGGDPDREYFRE